ncbi:MAG: hypothetical protein AAFX09_04425 [Pseudomonadota bacterium]
MRQLTTSEVNQVSGGWFNGDDDNPPNPNPPGPTPEPYPGTDSPWVPTAEELWGDYESPVQFNEYDDVTLYEDDESGATVSAGADNGAVGVTVRLPF